MKVASIKIFIATFFMSLTIGCDSETKEYSEADKYRMEQIKDSMMEEETKKIYDQIFGDTLGVSTSPIKVISSQIVESGSGRYRNVRLEFKNVSSKKVTAIKFIWRGVDAFGEPADMGNSLASGFGGGFTDDPINPGSVEDGTWEILSRNAKKVILAWPTEAVFVDGTKWKLKDVKTNN